MTAKKRGRTKVCMPFAIAGPPLLFFLGFRPWMDVRTAYELKLNIMVANKIKTVGRPVTVWLLDTHFVFFRFFIIFDCVCACVQGSPTHTNQLTSHFVRKEGKDGNVRYDEKIFFSSYSPSNEKSSSSMFVCSHWSVHRGDPVGDGVTDQLPGVRSSSLTFFTAHEIRTAFWRERETEQW